MPEFAAASGCKIVSPWRARKKIVAAFGNL
jgi:hypothetical protein